MLNIYLSNGGFILLKGGDESKAMLFNAIDERIDWVTIEEKTINTNYITWFEEYKPTEQEMGEIEE